MLLKIPEIWNPGELPKPLKPEDLKRKHKSIPRNKLLADTLFLIRFIEEWGRGTKPLRGNYGSL